MKSIVGILLCSDGMKLIISILCSDGMKLSSGIAVSKFGVITYNKEDLLVGAVKSTV